MSISPEFKNNRKLWIDALRGLAMLFVVTAHVANTDLPGKYIFNVFSVPITLPVFFAITGYVFNDHQGNQLVFYKNLFTKLIFPCMLVSLLNPELFPLKGIGLLAKHYYNIVSGTRYWYFSCCIVAEILFFYVRKFSKNPRQVIVGCVILWAIGLLLARMNILNFGMVNRAFIAQAYMLFGFIYRTWESHFSRIRPSFICLAAGLYLLLGIISIIAWPGQSIDVHLNQYYNIPFCMLIIYVGCFAVFGIFSKLPKPPKSLAILGQSTLVCYAVHILVMRVVRSSFDTVGIPSSRSWPVTLIIVALTCIICCIISKFLERYLPWTVGKKRRRKPDPA